MATLPHPIPPGLAELTAGRMRAAADPTRIRILDLLRHGERTVAQLTTALGTRQQTTSNHLGVLLAAGFVARRKVGTTARYRVADPAVLALCDRVRAVVEGTYSPLDTCGVDTRPADR